MDIGRKMGKGKGPWQGVQGAASGHSASTHRSLSLPYAGVLILSPTFTAAARAVHCIRLQRRKATTRNAGGLRSPHRLRAGRCPCRTRRRGTTQLVRPTLPRGAGPDPWVPRHRQQQRLAVQQPQDGRTRRREAAQDGAALGLVLRSGRVRQHVRHIRSSSASLPQESCWVHGRHGLIHFARSDSS